MRTSAAGGASVTVRHSLLHQAPLMGLAQAVLLRTSKRTSPDPRRVAGAGMQLALLSPLERTTHGAYSTFGENLVASDLQSRWPRHCVGGVFRLPKGSAHGKSWTSSRWGATPICPRKNTKAVFERYTLSLSHRRAVHINGRRKNDSMEVSGLEAFHVQGPRRTRDQAAFSRSDGRQVALNH